MKDFKGCWSQFRNSQTYAYGMGGLTIFLGVLLLFIHIVLWFIILGFPFISSGFIPHFVAILLSMVFGCIHAFIGGILYRVYQRLYDKYGF